MKVTEFKAITEIVNISFKHWEKILCTLTADFIWLFSWNGRNNSRSGHSRRSSWAFSCRRTSRCTACGWLFFVNEIFKVGASGFLGRFNNDWHRCSCYFRSCTLAFTFTLLLWLVFFSFLAFLASTLFLRFCLVSALFVLWLIWSFVMDV